MIYVVGIGPGDSSMITPEAVNAIESCGAVVGYTKYIALIEGLVKGKTIYASGMGHELERCRMCLEYVMNHGGNVALISSGDSGVYGMAGLMLEVASGSGVEVRIIPGITAALSCAAVLGAPIMNDYASISLSDIMTGKDLIERRLIAACLGDFVICLYNPASSKRPDNFTWACDILLRHKDPNTPAGFVRNVARHGQKHGVMTLREIRGVREIDMFCTVIIGNSQSYILDGKIITRRGYKL